MKRAMGWGLGTLQMEMTTNYIVSNRRWREGSTRFEGFPKLDCIILLTLDKGSVFIFLAQVLKRGGAIFVDYIYLHFCWNLRLMNRYCASFDSGTYVDSNLIHPHYRHGS